MKWRPGARQVDRVDLNSVNRYRVGCAGMFVLGMDSGYNDELDALAAALVGPPGCEVLDTQTNEWIGPYGPEDEAWVRERLEARNV